MLKKLFCNHDWYVVANLSLRLLSNGNSKQKCVLKCTICGKEKVRWL